MPFITEEIWQNIKNRDNPLIVENWERNLKVKANESGPDEINSLIAIITNIRSIKSEINIKSKEFLTLERKKGDKLKKITNLDFYLTKLANIESIREVTQFSDNSDTFKVNNSKFALIIPANIDLNNELSRVTKEEEKITKDISDLSKRLENKEFLNKAPKSVVEENLKKLTDMKEDKQRIESSRVLIEKLINNNE